MYDPATAVQGLEAVAAAQPENHAVQAALTALQGVATDAKYDRAELTLTVPRESIIAAAQAGNVEEGGAVRHGERIAHPG